VNTGSELLDSGDVLHPLQIQIHPLLGIVAYVLSGWSCNPVAAFAIGAGIADHPELRSESHEDSVQ